MKKLLLLLAIIPFITACGGGGGSDGGGSSGGEIGQTKDRIAITFYFNENNSFIKNGMYPALICGEKVYYPEETSSSFIRFSADRESTCYLSFYGSNGNIIRTARNRISCSSKSCETTLKDNWELQPGENLTLQPVTDLNNNTIADILEKKSVLNGKLHDSNVLNRLVVFVMSADEMGGNSLTDFLKANYNDMVYSVETDGELLAEHKTRIVVLWDGNLDRNLKSDVFIIEPTSEADFSVIEPAMEDILYGNGTVESYKNYGIDLWYAGDINRDLISENLKDILDLTFALYPAEHVDLIVGGHGDGWTSFEPLQRAVIFENDGRGGIYWLGTKQFVDRVLKPLNEEENVHFELLGFDECLMGELSTLSIMSPYADVLVASPDTEPDAGWGGAYKKVARIFTKQSGWDIGKAVVDETRNYYSGDYLKYAPPSISLFVGLTAIKSEALKEIYSKFDTFVNTMKESINFQNLYDFLIQSAPSFNSENESPIMITTADYRKIELSSDALNDSEISIWLNTLSNATVTAPLSFSYTSRFGYDPYYLAMEESLVAKSLTLGSHFKSPTSVGFNYFQLPLEDDTYTAGKDLLSAIDSRSGDIHKFYIYLDTTRKTFLDLSNSTSGIYVVWPFMATSQTTFKVNPCTYENYVESYKDILGNFTSFTEMVMKTWWNAANDTGLNVNCGVY